MALNITTEMDCERLSLKNPIALLWESQECILAIVLIGVCFISTF